MLANSVPTQNSPNARSTAADVSHLLWAKTVALIGASSDTAKISGKPLHNLRLHGFPGEILAVNPKYSDLDGIPCVPTVQDLPDDVDCALVLLPAGKVLETIESLAQRGVKSAIVVSGGFAEGGAEGRALQERISTLAREAGMRVLGPNTLGAVNFHGRTVLSFSTSFEEGSLSAGSVGFVSQSGALMGALTNRAADRCLGLSYAVATGNESDLDVSDFFEFFAADEHTQVVMALVEGIRDGQKFLHALGALQEAKKPVVLLKIGKSEPGQRAALAHTGALAGSARVFDAACRKTGAIQIEELEELLDTAELLVKGRLPKKRTLGVITTSGGAAALLADAAARDGYTFPSPSAESASRLKSLLPSFTGQSQNPVDLTGQHLSQPEVFRESVLEFLREDAFGGVVVIMAPGTGKPGKERAEILADLDRDAHKPLVACWIGGEQSAPGRRTCRENRIPVMDSPHSVAKAMARLADYGEGIQAGSSAPETIPVSVTEAVGKLPQGKGPVLTEFESECWLGECGLPILKGRLAGSVEEALEISGQLGYPVALKAMASDVPHKHKMGLVRLNLRDRDAVVQAFENLSSTLGAVSTDQGADILIEPMAAPGVDLLIGAHFDPTFGPVVVFGWGGIHTEIFDEVSLRLAPISRGEAEATLQEVRGFPALAENEFGDRIDLSRLGDALVRVSQVAAAGADRIESIDINPIRLGSAKGDCVVLDATVVLKETL